MLANPSSGHRRPGQAGFSMIEMLMTAFIMAIGILGLSMLQVMSLKASRGGRSLSTAVLVSEHVMDQVEMEARLSWLNATSKYNVTSLADLPTLQYVSLADGGSRVEFFNSKGGPTIGNPDPADNLTYFTVTTTKAVFVANAAGTNGALSDIKVQVQFTDQLDQASAPVQRTVTLNRRIVHG
jgi:prepilin-type N-terminal cleavage/methylation domain-containing protein